MGYFLIEATQFLISTLYSYIRVMAGEKLSAVARELGVNPNNLYLWKNSFASGSNEPELALEGPSAPAPESKDLAKENELLKLEIEYLRKREAILRRK